MRTLSTVICIVSKADNGVIVALNSTKPAVYNFTNNVFENNLNPLPAAGLGAIAPTPFGQPYGTAIYADNSAASSSASVNVIYAGLSPGLDHFINCSKSVTVSNMNATIRGAKVNHAVYGFSFDRAMHTYQIIGNTLTDVYYGMGFFGNTLNSAVRQNFITSSEDIERPYGSAELKYPIGVDVRWDNNTNPYTFDLLENTIEMNAYGAIGINLLQTGRKAAATDNIVVLRHSLTSIYNDYRDEYPEKGISLQMARGTQLHCNKITGDNGLIVSLPRLNVAGVSFDVSTDLLVECNILTQTRYGFLTINNCQTSYDKIRGNNFLSHHFGMLFRHLGTEGTFGNIGSNGGSFPAYDCNNMFFGVYSGGYKIWKQTTCTTPTFDRIFTTTPTLSSNESGSSTFPSCRYTPITNYGAPVFRCPDGCDRWDPSMPMIINNIALAEQVARDSVLYSEYQQGTSWLSALMLYYQLYHDSISRQQNPILDSFYTAMQAATIEDIRYADQLFPLPDTAFAEDSTLFAQWMIDAKAANNQIVSSDVLENNVRWINKVYLYYVEYGVDSISVALADSIGALAGECPLIAGSGVYMARALYAVLAPPVNYNDLEICNNAGAYKGESRGVFDGENEWLKNHRDEQRSFLAGDVFDVFPNPSNGLVTVMHSREGGMIGFYDMSGRLLQTGILQRGSDQTTIALQLTPGIYICRHTVNGVEKHSRKLVLVQ